MGRGDMQPGSDLGATRGNHDRVVSEGNMKYSDYYYSAATQADFFKAESNLLLLEERIARSPNAKYMKGTLLAIDAIFAIRIAHDEVLPVVPLVTAFDLNEWKYRGDTGRSVKARLPEFRFPESSLDAAAEALHYMQTMDWVAKETRADTPVTLETVLHLHEMLLNGAPNDNRYHGFRSAPLPSGQGADPLRIATEIDELCAFANTESYSPLGQSSIIHHAFERIAPFDTLVDRTGLALAFLSMFKRGLFAHGYMVPICWGASIEKNFRRKLRTASRDQSSPEAHERNRERWAAYNARNTHMSVVIADSFLAASGKLRAKWRSQNLQIPANSALDRLLDLFLAMPGLSTIRAAEIIGKSYGATNEAMRQLTQAGIVSEIAVDGRERIFICEQSAAMLTEFVESLVAVGQKAETGELNA